MVDLVAAVDSGNTRDDDDGEKGVWVVTMLRQRQFSQAVNVI